jgi:hypothetical protein
MRTLRAVSLSIVCCLLALGCLGCSSGEDRVAVAGKVELDGRPLEAGSITFLPQPGTSSPSAGAQIAGGTYRIPAEGGPKPGVYRVQVSSTRKTGKRIPAGSPAPDGTMVDEVVEAVPLQYNRESTLAATLTAGDNSFDCLLSTSKTTAKTNLKK